MKKTIIKILLITSLFGVVGCQTTNPDGPSVKLPDTPFEYEK